MNGNIGAMFMDLSKAFDLINPHLEQRTNHFFH